MSEIIGFHIIGDFLELDFENINLQKVLEKGEKLLKENNFNVVGKNFHNFSDEKSFTIIFLLAESHLSFHSWPEKNLIHFDLFTCKKDKNKESAVKLFEELKIFLNCKNVKTHFIDR